MQPPSQFIGHQTRQQRIEQRATGRRETDTGLPSLPHNQSRGRRGCNQVVAKSTNTWGGNA